MIARSKGVPNTIAWLQIYYLKLLRGNKFKRERVRLDEKEKCWSRL